MTDTYHSPHPDIWRVDHAIDHLRTIDWKAVKRTIDAGHDQARPARTPSRRDGYPGSTLGGRGSSDLTSVEAAADANIFGDTTPETESLYDLVRDARALLTETSGTAAQLLAKLELIKHLLGQTEHATRGCALCGATDRLLIYGTVAGRLATNRDLCEAGPNGSIGCYQVVSKNNGWPTTEQIEEHARTGKWRYRAS